MPTLRPVVVSRGAFLCSLLASQLVAQVTVEGVADKTVYVDQVSFKVPTVAGWTYTVALNGAPSQAGVDVVVAAADYYQVLARRKNDTTSAEETTTVQFIVRSSERQNSEWGLPPWVPYPSIPSAQAEFVGAHLKLIVPEGFPQGLDIPVVAWVEDASNQRVGVNGVLKDGAIEPKGFWIRRGAGSGYLPSAASGGPIAYQPQLGGISATKSIAIDSTTTWTNAAGTISTSTNWGENARVSITGDIALAAGVTLTIGAGTVVRLAGGADIAVAGTLRIEGTIERPVVFLPAVKTAPWGGIQWRTATSLGEIQGAIFVGSGSDPSWFDNDTANGHSHREEQPCLFVAGQAQVHVTDSALIDGAGQAEHGEGGFLTMTRTLAQRFISCGQFNDGSLKLESCAIMEFPYDGAPFADSDNDAIYLTGGAHFITNTLIGWARDDGIDAGSGDAGPVTVTGCWIESTFHEGMAWSEDRLPTVKDTVAINCGQGIECGFGSPDVKATHILSTANLSGARFGDNYDWTYSGTLNVSGSLILNNYRDIWGRAWDNWSEHTSQMSLTGNWITAADPLHPSNSVWNPAQDAALLEPFLPVPAGDVGVGIALRTDTFDVSEIAKGIPVRLSTFTTHAVTVNYSVSTEDGPLDGGSLVFAQGETVKRFTPEIANLASHTLVLVTLTGAAGGELTGLKQVSYANLTPVVLIPKGSVWRFNDSNVNLGTSWRDIGFADAAWKSGPAQLGFGDNGEVTPVNGGPSNARTPTIYFRRQLTVDDPTSFESLTVRIRRDDGAVVYLNGQEVYRTNMPSTTIEFGTYADSSSTSETTFFEQTFAPDALVQGDNVIAVEVHQANATSGDLSFDLELGAVTKPIVGPLTFARGDANQDGEIDISDPLRILFYLFAGTAVGCQDALDGDDDGAISLTDAIYILRYLFQGGPRMPEPFPGLGVDPTDDALGCVEG